jgi:DNA-binding NarL/FixJ family response regulator
VPASATYQPVTNDQKTRQQAIAVLVDLIREDSRFVAGTRHLVMQTDARGQRIIPMAQILYLAVLARKMKLESLPAPCWLLYRAKLESSTGASPSLADSRLSEQVTWFYRRFSLGRSRIQIADQAGYSEETIRSGIRRVREILNVHQRRGRPSRYPHLR